MVQGPNKDHAAVDVGLFSYLLPLGDARNLDAQDWLSHSPRILCSANVSTQASLSLLNVQFFRYFGLFVSPWYQLRLIMVAELVPPSKVFLFFSLFNVLGQTSSFTGPLITQRIISDANGNTSYAYIFLLPMAVISFILMLFVNVDKAQIECRACSCFS